MVPMGHSAKEGAVKSCCCQADIKVRRSCVYFPEAAGGDCVATTAITGAALLSQVQGPSTHRGFMHFSHCFPFF